MDNINLPPQPGQPISGQPAQPQQQIQIRAENKDLKGHYSNLVQIKNTKEEFVFDFLAIIPPVGSLVGRIYMNPPHAKRMAAALNGLVTQYEQKFGPIDDVVSPDHNIGFKTDQ